ncbi:MAG: hypothetical protein K1X95_16845, partial [Acidimicrobiia bacterium]|nr:hypothetical protein [Acidimicrobiia bacterium]
SDSVRRRMLAGLIAVRSGDAVQAVQYLEECARADSDSSTTLLHYARALILADRPADAIPILIQARDLAADRTSLILCSGLLASLCRDAGQSEDELAVWRYAHDRFPADREIIRELTGLLEDAGRFEDGAVFLETAVLRAQNDLNSDAVAEFRLQSARLRLKSGQMPPIPELEHIQADSRRDVQRRFAAGVLLESVVSPDSNSDVLLAYYRRRAERNGDDTEALRQSAALADLSERWSRPALPIEAVALRTVLGDAVAGWWESQSSPVAPARAVAGMAAALGPRGLVAADPGDAGLWVARSYATTRLGSVAVPARGGTEGWAAACTFVAMLRDPSRRTLAVVDHLDPLTAGIVDLARRRGLPLVVVVWDRDAAPTSPEEHDARIGRALAERRPAVLRVGVDRTHTDDLVDIAGRVVAWT